MQMSFLVLALCITCIKLHAQSVPFSVKGKFKNQTQSGFIYLYHMVNETMHKDSSLIKNGAFRFSGKLLHPSPATLNFKNKGKDVFIEPGVMEILIEDEELSNIEILGSKSHLEFSEITNKISRIDKRWKTVFDTLDAVNSRSNADFQNMKSWVLQPYFAEIREAYLDFFEQYPQSYVTAYFLSLNILEANQGLMPAELLQKYHSGFATPVKESSFGQKIQKQLSNNKVGVPGTTAIDFTKRTLKGQTLRLTSFRGKYLLLDFWGSWCVPCRKGHPALKELYYRYRDKGFEIIGVAKDDDTKDAWSKAVEQDGLPWPQILVGDLDTRYNVSSYPTKILIDQQGIIIGRYGEDLKELDEKLTSIFTLN